jgi:hypothetical protein
MPRSVDSIFFPYRGRLASQPVSLVVLVIVEYRAAKMGLTSSVWFYLAGLCDVVGQTLHIASFRPGGLFDFLYLCSSGAEPA